MQSRGWIFVRTPLQPQALKERLAGFTLSKWLIVNPIIEYVPANAAFPADGTACLILGNDLPYAVINPKAELDTKPLYH
jgi:hypothetical protein